MKLVTTIYDWLSRRTGGVTPRKKELRSDYRVTDHDHMNRLYGTQGLKPFSPLWNSARKPSLKV